MNTTNAFAQQIERRDEAAALNLEDLAKSLEMGKGAIPAMLEQVGASLEGILSDAIAKVLKQAAAVRAGEPLLPPAPVLPERAPESVTNMDSIEPRGLMAMEQDAAVGAAFADRDDEVEAISRSWLKHNRAA